MSYWGEKKLKVGKQLAPNELTMILPLNSNDFYLRCFTYKKRLYKLLYRRFLLVEHIGLELTTSCVPL